MSSLKRGEYKKIPHEIKLKAYELVNIYKFFSLFVRIKKILLLIIAKNRIENKKIFQKIFLKMKMNN